MSHTSEATGQRFSDAEMDIVRNTDLPDLLTSLGYNVRRVGSYHTTREMDSLRIKDRRRWYRYSEKIGGDAITFLQHFCGMDFPEAVKYLLAFHGRSRDSPGKGIEKRSPKEERVPFALPPPSGDSRRVFAYLRKRGVSPEVINGFLKAGLLYEDAEHHNCVFVGRDAVGTPVFATKRGTYDLNGAGFKGDVPGSNKAVAFRLPCDPAQDAVFVFEAPIDLMSFCSLNRGLASNAVALCCLDDGALATYLKENLHLKKIVLCLDTDRWGREASAQLREKYRGLGYGVDILEPPCGKDWNEYLQQRVQRRERGR